MSEVARIDLVDRFLVRIGMDHMIMMLNIYYIVTKNIFVNRIMNL